MVSAYEVKPKQCTDNPSEEKPACIKVHSRAVLVCVLEVSILHSPSQSHTFI